MITFDSHLKTALSTTDHWTWAIANENEFAIQTKKPRKPHVSSKVQNDCSEKVQHLSRFQLFWRKKKTIAALKPIYCGSNNMSVSDDQSVQDGLYGQHWLAQLQNKWWKLISLIQLFAWMILYPRLLKGELKNMKKVIKTSRRPCTHEVTHPPPEKRNGGSRRQATDHWRSKTGCV